MGKLILQRMIILSILKKRRVLFSLDEVLGEARKWFLINLDSQKSLRTEQMGTTSGFQFANNPTPLEDRKMYDEF